MMRSMSVPLLLGALLLGFGGEASPQRTQKFEASDAEHALLVVSFDQDIAQTVNARARYVKDEILRHVDELINELAGRNGP